MVDSVRIEVVDPGPDIPPAAQATVFEEFRQIVADGGHQRPSSTGLGLAVVKSFVELPGGVVRVRSLPGQGSTFEVLLPTNVSAEAERRATGA